MNHLPSSNSLIGAFLLLALSGQAFFSPSAYGQKPTQDNLGLEFYVAFGENVGSTEDATVFELYIASPHYSKGIVSVPALDFSVPFTTAPGAITTISLPDGRLSAQSVELLNSEVVERGMGVHITSDSEIGVFGMNHKVYSSDAFMALPVDVLGTEYRTMNYQSSVVSGGQETPGEFWMVATADSTTVTITPKTTTAGGRSPDVPFSLRLNRGDAYQVQSQADVVGSDLTGSLIESDLPIAVFSGHKRTAIPEGAKNVRGQPSRDHLVEQLPPVSAWGDSAFVIPFFSTDLPDLCRILSAEPGNEVKVNGTLVATLNAGEFYEIRSFTTIQHIEATKPILVGQYMHTTKGADQGGPNAAYGDPALALVFPVEQFTTSYTFLSVENPQAFDGNFINIVAEADGVGTMTLDGAVIAATNFSPILGSAYSYAQLRIQQGTHNIVGTKPFGITVYALGGADSYAYTGGTLTKTITPLKTTDLVIDFRERLLKPDLTGYWDTTVYLKNVSQDPVNIYDFPKRTADIGKFFVIAPQTPHRITAGFTDSMTIRFEPLEAGRRMHTQITAKTDHLRAYVVDVYGIGILESFAVFTDTLAKAIDTIDFGFFQTTDPPKDTTIYISNTGPQPTSLLSASLRDLLRGFGITSLTHGGTVATLPDSLGPGRKDPLKMTLRFTPTATVGKFETKLEYKTTRLSQTVVLLAEVGSVQPPTLLGVGFDSILICKPTTRSLTIKNENSFAVTVTGAKIGGANAGDYQLLTGAPMVVGPRSSNQINVLFSPANQGLSVAWLELRFDRPTNYLVSVPLRGYSRKQEFSFAFPAEQHVLTGEGFRLPFYSNAAIDPYQAKGYKLTLHYDPTYIEDVDWDQDYTLSNQGSVEVSGNAGERTYTYKTYGEALMTGGGKGTSLPVIYLKFSSTTAGNAKPEFHQVVPITFSIELIGANIEPSCTEQVLNTAEVVLDSTCEIVRVIAGITPPDAFGLSANRPNPFTPSTVIPASIPYEANVKVEIVDPVGRTVRVLQDGVLARGHYQFRLSGAGLASGIYFVRLSADGKPIRTRTIMMQQ